MEGARDQQGDTRAGPALVVPAVHGRSLAQEPLQQPQLLVGEFTAVADGALGDQRGLAATLPQGVPFVGGLGRDIQQLRVRVGVIPPANMSVAWNRSLCRRSRSGADSPPLLSEYLILQGCHLANHHPTGA